MDTDFERFDGREHSVFADMAKGLIRDLIYDLADAEEEIIAGKNSAGEDKKYYQLRKTFRACYILMADKMQDTELKKDIKDWIWFKPANDMKARRGSIESASKLIEMFFKDLAEVGLIDLKGGSYAGAYPFCDMLIGNSPMETEVSNLSDFDKALLETVKRMSKPDVTSDD